MMLGAFYEMVSNESTIFGKNQARLSKSVVIQFVTDRHTFTLIYYKNVLRTLYCMGTSLCIEMQGFY